MNIINKIIDLNVGEVIKDVNVKSYTTYKIDCIALGLVIPDTVESLIELLKFLRGNSIKYKIIGKGSNLIFTNDKYDGILISLDAFSNLEIDSNHITVGAGYSLIKLAYRLSRQGFAGLEFAAGIPGSIGGAIYMNAGAYGEEMSGVIESVTYIDCENNIKTDVFTLGTAPTEYCTVHGLQIETTFESEPVIGSEYPEGY